MTVKEIVTSFEKLLIKIQNMWVSLYGTERHFVLKCSC